MKLVPFSTNKWTQDTHFMISDEAYDKIKDFKWYVVNTVTSKQVNKAPYFLIARTSSKEERLEGWPSMIKLSRYLFNFKKSQKEIVDHKNGWLDNTFESLRITDKKNNNRYCGPKKRTAEKSNDLPKGVFLKKGLKKNPYMAQIQVDGKFKYLGYYPTPELAHEAYKKAALQYFGEFAKFE